MEKMNEIILLIGFDILPLFTDWVLEPKYRYTFCWWWLGIVLGSLVFVNVFNIVLIGFG